MQGDAWMKKRAGLFSLQVLLSCVCLAAFADEGAKQLSMTSVPGSTLASRVDEGLFAELNVGVSGYRDLQSRSYTYYLPVLFRDIALGKNDAVRKAIAKGDDLRGFYPILGANEDSKKAQAECFSASPSVLYDALMASALFGNLEAARMIAAAGADVNARHDRFHHTALECAVLGGKAGPEFLSFLIEEGADKASLSAALVQAVWRGRRDLAKLLLDKGADPDAKSAEIDNPAQTALLAAAWTGDAEAVDMLLAAGANPNLRSVISPDCFRELVALGYAGAYGDSRQLYLNTSIAGPSLDGRTSTRLDKALADYEGAEMVLRSVSPLQAALHGHGYVFDGSYSMKPPSPERRSATVRILASLLSHGADPDDARDAVSPLAFAVAYGFSDEAILLLKGGASPFARSYKGESILYYLRSGVQDEILFRNACDILAKGYDRILRAMYDSCGTALEKASLKRQMETEMKAAIDAVKPSNAALKAAYLELLAYI